MYKWRILTAYLGDIYMYLLSIIGTRLFELFTIEALASSILMLLFEFIITPYKILVVILTVVFLGVFYLFQIFMLRGCYIGLGRQSLYIVSNIIVNFIFILINMFFYFYTNNVVYSWFFSAFKIFRYTFNVGIGFSAMVCQLALMMLIFAAPFGLPPINIREP